MPPTAGRPGAPPPLHGARPGQADLAGLRLELEGDISRIEGENGEIDLLMEQVLTEVERHESRRSKMESQLATMETNPAADQTEVAELRDGLLALTRREMLFDAQRQVLEGKQRVLARFLQRLVEIDNSLADMGGGPTRPAPTASVGLRALAEASGGRWAVAITRWRSGSKSCLRPVAPAPSDLSRKNPPTPMPVSG